MIEELYQLSDEERWLRIELAGEFKKDFRGKVGNMIKQRTGRYRWGMQGKVEKRAKRKVRTAAAKALGGRRAQMGAGDMFPSDESIMAMQVSDLKARLYLWRERKPEFRGPPLFEQGKQGWLGGGRPALQDRLKKAVRHWQLENKPVQAEFTWTDETYDEDEFEGTGHSPV